MKTKNFFFMMIAFVWTLFSVSLVDAAAVLPMSSGIKVQIYGLEWCSPHYNRLEHTWSTPCRTGYFQAVWGVAKVVYNGQSFPSGNIPANANPPSSSTRTSQTLSSVTALVDFFSNTTNGAFAMEGEGVLTIRAYMTDYAENTSFYKVVYKIDKTAPQLALPNVGAITESTDYTHYGDRVAVSATVTKNDSATNPSNGDSYGNPLITQYTGDSPAPRATHVRPNLHAFYFKNLDTTPFTLSKTHSDTYGTHLTATATSPLPEGYSWPLVSGEKNFELVTEGGIAVATKTGLASDFTNANLTDNNENTQKKYRLRLYDNTVDSSGGARTGNYSETAFYAVRDNTKPNMGGNGLAGADTNLAIEKLLSFPDNDTVYDKTITSYNPTINGVSRFLGATMSQPIQYKLADTGITGNGVITGINASYNLYNAGLNTTNLKVNIEDATTPSSYPTFTTFSQRFDNTGSADKHFNKVDNDLVSNGTYRKYTVQFEWSPTITGVCDLVGNCLEPKLDFRVVANTVSDSTSQISLAGNTQSVSGKMIANGTDSYKLSYVLKDVHGNKLVPVKSAENNNLQIKTVDTATHFQNGLHTNQLSKTPSGTKLASVTDLETDNVSGSFAETINAAGSVSMQEWLTGVPNGRYSMALSSKVPTKGFYPYISDNSLLRVSSIASSATGSAPSGMTYPKTGDRIGYFAQHTSTGWTVTTSDFTIPNKGSLGETADFTAFNFTETDYGKVTFSTASDVLFTAFANRRVNLEFASPFIYGLDNMVMGSLTNNTFVTHTKKLYTPFSSFIPTSRRVYEKILVAYDTTKDEQPGILDFRIRRNSSDENTFINSGACYGGTCENMFLAGGAPVQKSLTLTDNTSVQINMSPIIGKVYDTSKIHRGFVSSITYSPDGTNTIKLPSVARDINDSAGSMLEQFNMARYYFSDDYSLGYSSDRVQDMAAALSDIAITGLTNKYNGITTGTGGNKANVDIGAELTRFNIVTSIKKNVSFLSAGLWANNSSQPKRWCTGMTINQSFLNSDSDACTQTINGEVISFIDGNATLDCGDICKVSQKRSIIVKNGSLFIKSNITTLDAGSQTNGQLFLGVMNDAGLANIEIDAENPNITDADKKGWLFVNTSITNIDAFLFAQGPMISYNETGTGQKFYSLSSPKSDYQLRNQLHIMGSLLTLNTIGEAQIPKCPYIVTNCTEETAPIFDLINLRNFKFTSLSTYTSNPSDNTTMTPYHPDGNGIAKVSGGNTETREPIGTGDVSCNTGSPDLRCITDRDYRPYPMLIERDLRWNSNPSELFKISN